jgi:hypothetical protein
MKQLVATIALLCLSSTVLAHDIYSNLRDRAGMPVVGFVNSGTPDGMAAAMLATLTKTDDDNTATSTSVIIFKT